MSVQGPTIYSGQAPGQAVAFMSCANMQKYGGFLDRPFTQPCRRYYSPKFSLPARSIYTRHAAISRRQSGAEGAAEIAAVLDVSILETPQVKAALVEATKISQEAAQSGTVSLRDLSGTYELAPQANGNLLLVKSGGSFSFRFAVTDTGAVYGDGVTSTFMYDAREMAAFGVARFRYKPITDITRSSQFVTLNPISTSMSNALTADTNTGVPGIYVAIDAKLNLFLPVVCSIGDETKMFLVKDLDTGIATLQSGELQVVVTGGPATKCAVVSLFTPGEAGL